MSPLTSSRRTSWSQKEYLKFIKRRILRRWRVFITTDFNLKLRRDSTTRRQIIYTNAPALLYASSLNPTLASRVAAILIIIVWNAVLFLFWLLIEAHIQFYMRLYTFVVINKYVLLFDHMITNIQIKFSVQNTRDLLIFTLLSLL